MRLTLFMLNLQNAALALALITMTVSAGDVAASAPQPAILQLVTTSPNTQIGADPDVLWQIAWRDLQQLSADEMAGRSSGSAGSLLAQNYLQQRFSSLGLTAVSADYRQPFDFKIGFSKQQGVNLVAKRQGCRYPQLYIVVTAHYDHLAARGRQIFNGADDNASGVAGLLYLAGLLQQQCPAYSYLFVATDAEEHGLDGAKAFLATPPVPQSQMVLNINLDMIGRGEKSNRLYLLGKRSLPHIINMPRSAQDGVNLILASENRSSGRGNAKVDWTNASDHGAFRRAGIPYLYFGVDVHPDYHTPDDDWQRIQPEFFRAALEHIGATLFWLEQQTPTQLQHPRPPQKN